MTIESLKNLYEEYKALPMPRTSKGVDIFGVDDVDIYLYSSDSYISGLVSRFLSDRELPVVSIVLNSFIDTWLNEFVFSSPEESEIITKFKIYREKMVELAFSLSQVSRVPIEWEMLNNKTIPPSEFSHPPQS